MNEFQIPDIDVNCEFCGLVQSAQNYKCERCGKELPFRRAWLGDAPTILVFRAIMLPIGWFGGGLFLIWLFFAFRAGLSVDWPLVLGGWGGLWLVLFLVYWLLSDHSPLEEMDRRRTRYDYFSPLDHVKAGVPNNSLRGRAALVPVDSIVKAWAELYRFWVWKNS